MAKKENETQNKYDALLLTTIKSIDRKVDKLTDELKDNSSQTLRNAAAIKKVDRQVQKQNSSIAKLEGINEAKEMTEPKTIKDLQPFWRDTNVLKVVTIFAVALIILLYLIAAVFKVELPTNIL